MRSNSLVSYRGVLSAGDDAAFVYDLTSYYISQSWRCGSRDDGRTGRRRAQFERPLIRAAPRCGGAMGRSVSDAVGDACGLGGMGRLGRAGRRARQGEVRDELARRPGGWRLLSGRGRRHLRQIRTRRHRHSRRPADQRGADAAVRQDRLLHGRRPDRRFHERRKQTASRGGRRRLSKVAADPDVASRRRPGQMGGSAESEFHLSRRGLDQHLLRLAQTRLRIQG